MTDTAGFAPQRMTPEYARAIGRVAYVWGWPLANLHNRRIFMKQLTEPSLLAGIVPAGPPGTLGMLHDYVDPQERIVACPNQDVVYGFGVLDAKAGPTVIQIPDFGDRFWVYQVVDQRTDSFVELGAMYGTSPGFYLLAPTSWDGEAPAGITGVFRYDTRAGVVIPRVFLNDTDEDRAAVAPLINGISMYPLSDFDGRTKTVDWARIPSIGGGEATGGQSETQWVDPHTYFTTLRTILDEVPARPGEEALYATFRQLLDAADEDPEIAAALTQSAVDAEQSITSEMFEFRKIGIPIAHNWSTQRNGARFGTDYLSRTAMAKSNIFVNSPNETAYYYQDLDDQGERLHGSHSYSVHFAAEKLPPVRGFWSLTVYNEQHFFFANDLDRYSLGTKNTHLMLGSDGSLTLTVGGDKPTDGDSLANWLPAPDSAFSLYLRAYWPDESLVEGAWEPPRVLKLG